MKIIKNLCLTLIISALISSCAVSDNSSDETSGTEASSKVSDTVSAETEASLNDNEAETTEENDSGFETFEESAIKAGKIAGEIFDCFKEEDSERLKGFFSQYIEGKYDLDAQIKEAFALIDGEIISSDNPTGMPSDSAVEDGIWVRRELSCDIKNINTDSGKTYRIKINYLDLEKKNPDKVGCTRILILETTPDSEQTNTVIIGE
ncbi:MAG: DUF5104 domain-containing protein [Ruminiclostridium sp.]|nr:DUF5104 domain-containing protein [Ruminiclostridium sp.]